MHLKMASNVPTPLSFGLGKQISSQDSAHSVWNREGMALAICAFPNYRYRNRVVSPEHLQTGTVIWPGLACPVWPATLQWPLKPAAEMPQGAHANAFLNSNNIYHRTPQLPLLFVSKQLPGAACKSYQANAITSLGWCPLTCGCFFGLPLFLFKSLVSVDDPGFTDLSLLMLALSTVSRW